MFLIERAATPRTYFRADAPNQPGPSARKDLAARSTDAQRADGIIHTDYVTRPRRLA